MLIKPSQTHFDDKLLLLLLLLLFLELKGFDQNLKLK